VLVIRNSGEAVKVLDQALTRVDRLEERWFDADPHRLKGEAPLPTATSST
jgi:hypothetical protein